VRKLLLGVVLSLSCAMFVPVAAGASFPPPHCVLVPVPTPHWVCTF